VYLEQVIKKENPMIESTLQEMGFHPKQHVINNQLVYAGVICDLNEIPDDKEAILEFLVSVAIDTGYKIGSADTFAKVRQLTQ
jgi:hypothetical protein